MNRRTFVTALGALAGIGAGRAAPAAETFEVTRTDAEWRAMLTDLQYAVMRQEATEPPFSSPLLGEHRVGTYFCRGCGQHLYDSSRKYDSGTGWPSFWEAYPDVIATRTDRKLIFQVRTECHCNRCGSHLGHIFDDGPKPTGKRHCINGVSLQFRPSVM